jgi:hypothetical protein
METKMNSNHKSPFGDAGHPSDGYIDDDDAPEFPVSMADQERRSSDGADNFVEQCQWPRPSDVVLAEIEARIPKSLRWLRVELEEAFKKEALAAKAAG